MNSDLVAKEFIDRVEILIKSICGTYSIRRSKLVAQKLFRIRQCLGYHVEHCFVPCAETSQGPPGTAFVWFDPTMDRRAHAREAGLRCLFQRSDLTRQPSTKYEDSYW